MKECRMCKENKELDLFPSYIKKRIDGSLSKKYYRPDCYKCTQVKFRAKRYGISIDLAIEKDAVPNCEVCNRELEGKQRNFDHCHKTGKFRGVLCTGCNRALGFADENTQTLWKLIKYIEKWQNKG